MRAVASLRAAPATRTTVLARAARSLAVAASLLGGSAQAQDAKADEAAAKKSRESLRLRAQQWLDLRKTIVYACPNCDGRGAFRGKDCSHCVRGARVSADKAKQAYWEYGSPAWRADPTAIRTMTAFLDTLPSDPVKALLRNYKIESVELVGSQFGVVRVTETHEKTSIAPDEHRWVLATDPKSGTQRWYLWHDTVDPPFGEGPARAEPEPGVPAPRPPAMADTPAALPAMGDAPPTAPPFVDLPAEDRDTLEKTLAVAGVRHAVGAAKLAGGTLVVSLRATGIRSEGELDEAVAKDVVPAARTAFGAHEKSTTLRLVFEARYRDKLGDVSYLPYRTYSMARDLFSKIKFENLSREEVLDLFDREDVSHRLEGVVPWWKD